MIFEILNNIAYMFYPKNICCFQAKEKYLDSQEYKKLFSIIDFFELNWSKELNYEFNKNIILKDFKNLSRLDMQDRCLTYSLNLVEDGELQSITLYMSILVPYYVIVTNKHKIELFFSKSKIEELEMSNLKTRKIKDLVLEIENIVESKLLFQKFPEELMNFVIKDIAFQDIGLGRFTMFNAFFNNQIIRLNEN